MWVRVFWKWFINVNSEFSWKAATNVQNKNNRAFCKWAFPFRFYYFQSKCLLFRAFVSVPCAFLREIQNRNYLSGSPENLILSPPVFFSDYALVFTLIVHPSPPAGEESANTLMPVPSVEGPLNTCSRYFRSNSSKSGSSPNGHRKMVSQQPSIRLFGRKHNRSPVRVLRNSTRSSRPLKFKNPNRTCNSYKYKCMGKPFKCWLENAKDTMRKKHLYPNFGYETFRLLMHHVFGLFDLAISKVNSLSDRPVPDAFIN